MVSGYYCRKDFGQGCASESEAEDENGESGECTSESETEGENDESNEESAESDDDDVDVRASAEALKKLVPCNLEEFAKVGHSHTSIQH